MHGDSESRLRAELLEISLTIPAAGNVSYHMAGQLELLRYHQEVGIIMFKWPQRGGEREIWHTYGLQGVTKIEGRDSEIILR